MCLWSKKEVSMEADHDIKVYKVFAFAKKRNLYYSPVFEHEYKDFQTGQIYIDKKFDFDSPKYHCPFKDFTCKNGELYEINKGLHSFGQKEDAINFQNWLDVYYSMDTVIAECIIPKGTAYYAGFDDNNKITFCSQTLIINEIY